MSSNSKPVNSFRPPEVIAIRGTSKSQFYNEIAAGLMTRPIKPSAKLAFWPASEVEAIQAARHAGHSPEQMRELVKRLHEKRLTDAASILEGV